MKKNFIYALMSAIALTSAVGFTACSSSDEVAQDNTNPTYDGTSVRTDFAFNITKASKGTTRMTAAIAQETGAFDFRGMTDMYLLAFHGDPSSTATASANYPLLTLDNTTDITSSKSSKVYSLTIPVGTDNFLFYGKADRSGTNYVNGRVSSSFYDANGDKTDGAEGIKSKGGIAFSLTPLKTSLGTDATNIAAYLTAIAGTTGWAGTVTTSSTNAAYSSLADLYNKFTKNYSARSGSAESVKRMVLDLYRSAKAINAESSVGDVVTIATAICTSINTAVNGLKIVVDDTNADPENWTATFSGFDDEEFPAGVPASASENKLELPMGIAQLTWNGSAFLYNDNPYYNVPATGAGNYAALSNYCYPAELLYFDNSPLRATNEYKTIADYPTTTANWDADLGTAGGFDATWTGTEVQSTTRAVAMKNNINYGVSLLQSVAYLTTTSLKDNKTTILSSPSDINQTITIGQSYTVGSETKTREITLKGILVGGQPGTVNWQMLPTSTEFDHVIYDKTLPTDATHNWNMYVPVNVADLTPIYTVVFDNYKESDQQDVLVALEFVNNTGIDFYGVNGMIPAGNTFYLVGKLELSTAADTWTSSYPTGYRVPQSGVKRVFGQDHKAVAKFRIGETSLQKAYSTIPDLRSTEVLFGLSVDLNWEAGMTFTVDL